MAEHYFRHEYGRLVALLARRVGVRHIERVEDAVQTALMAAITNWTAQGLPEEPGAWLYRVAYNQLIGELRKKSGRNRILENTIGEVSGEESDSPATHFHREVGDALLRMLFVCCDEGIPRDSRLVLALKTLCGFSVAEIALRLFITEANVRKRLSRARDRLGESTFDTDTPALQTLRARLPSVHEVLYLLFNEGYLSAHEDAGIRRELCEEAVRLAEILARHPVGESPETFALLALMHFHAARLAARTDGSGGLLLLEEQDRTLWDGERMRVAMEWLARAAQGGVFSRYHAEAGIAAEHCLADSFGNTRWNEIADLYSLLESVAPSPLHTLNRAVAVAEGKGAEAGLAVLQAFAPPAWLEASYLWNAVSADLHRRCGNADVAARFRMRALALAPTEGMRIMLRRRLGDSQSREGGAPIN